MADFGFAQFGDDDLNDEEEEEGEEVCFHPCIMHVMMCVNFLLSISPTPVFNGRDTSHHLKMFLFGFIVRGIK